MKNLHRDAVFFSHFSRAVFTWGTAFDEWQCADLFTENPQMFCMIDVVGKNLHTECKKVLKSQGYIYIFFTRLLLLELGERNRTFVFPIEEIR